MDRTRCLNGTFKLHDVADVELMCRGITKRFYERNPILLDCDREDLLAYLIAVAWRLSEQWTPTTPNARFGAYARPILSSRCIDWCRDRYGRTRWQWKDHTYERGYDVRGYAICDSLDKPLRGDPDNPGTLRDVVADRADDTESDRDENLAWLFRAGARASNRDFHTVHSWFAKRTRRRDTKAAA